MISYDILQTLEDNCLELLDSTSGLVGLHWELEKKYQYLYQKVVHVRSRRLMQFVFTRMEVEIIKENIRCFLLKSLEMPLQEMKWIKI